MSAFHTLGSLMVGRIAGFPEILERARALALPDHQALHDHADAFERVPAPDRDPLHLLDGFRVVDLRDVPDAKRPARGRSVGLRRVESVEAICWHQTAAPGLDVDHRLLLGLPAHALVDQDGAIALLHRVTAYVYHGHHWNRDTIGIEVSARAPGIEGDSRTFWRSSKEKKAGLTMADLQVPATDVQLKACEALARYYAALMAAREAPLRAWVTHRQSSTKAADPGERIARRAAKIGFDLELPEDWTTVVRGKGRPQPSRWRLAA